MDIVSDMCEVGAVALSLVSVDMRAVGVRVQLSLGWLTLDLSKHLV